MLFIEYNPFITSGVSVDDSNSLANNMCWFGINEVTVAGSRKGDGYNPIGVNRRIASVYVETALENKFKIKNYVI